ncbi:ORF6N domain-containing protein [bacterium D16-51]|nr:ORF6N domain-containing protein [bacterium D16-59]RKI54195.1 ORF6N domain-containing protein [bacterium D16-51]
MSEIVTIENTEMEIREYNGQRVVTFKEIDLVHHRPNGTASRNFKKNRKYFVENEDYFILTREKANGRNSSIGGLILVTESGYLMIVKSFKDDLSWQVQRQLVNSYFRQQQPVVEQKKPQLTAEEIVDWKLSVMVA